MSYFGTTRFIIHDLLLRFLYLNYGDTPPRKVFSELRKFSARPQAQKCRSPRRSFSLICPPNAWNFSTEIGTDWLVVLSEHGGGEISSEKKRGGEYLSARLEYLKFRRVNSGASLVGPVFSMSFTRLATRAPSPHPPSPLRATIRHRYLIRASVTTSGNLNRSRHPNFLNSTTFFYNSFVFFFSFLVF